MSLLDLDAAKAHLNIAVSTHDDELQEVIDAAESRLAQEVGALEPAPRTDRVRGGACELVLPALPVAALTSVTPVDGDAIDVALLHLDRGAGVVTYNAGSTFGSALYDVVYVPGTLEAPAHVLQAVKELVRHLWKTQRGQQRQDPEAEAGSAFTLPRRVLELIDREAARQSGFA